MLAPDCFKSISSFLTSAMPIGSSPLIGSSSINTSGSCITALAIANRCFIPSEYFEKSFLSLYGKLTNARAFCTASSSSAFNRAKMCKFSVPVKLA